MDAAEINSALEIVQKDLRRCLRGNDDAVNKVNIRVWKRWKSGKSLRSVRGYALWTAKKIKIDLVRDAKRARAARHKALETTQCRSHELTLDPLARSPLDFMCSSDGIEQIEDAIATLPLRQRQAVQMRIRPAPSDSDATGEPVESPHHANYCKAKANLKTLLARRDAQDTSGGASSPGDAAPRRRVSSSTTPSAPSTALVAPSATTKEGPTRAKEGSTEAVDPSTTTIDPLTTVVEPSTALVEPSTRAVDPSTKGVDRVTGTVDRAEARGICARHVTGCGLPVA